MKTICIHQPDFAPYIGFFDRLLNSDHFVILDNVQFIRRGWHHRIQGCGPEGGRESWHQRAQGADQPHQRRRGATAVAPWLTSCTFS